MLLLQATKYHTGVLHWSVIIKSIMFSPVTIGILWTIIGTTVCDETANTNNTICNDEECKKLVSQVTKQMGSSPPCDDFYNYTCGNWEGDRELKHREIKAKAVRDLIVLLDNATISPQWNSNATEELINAYNSCVKTGGDEVKLTEAVKSALSSYGLKEWPIQGNSNNEDNSYKEILKKTGPRPLFRYFVSEDNSTPIILMTKPKEFFVFHEDVADMNAVSLSFRSDESETTTEDYDYSQYEQAAEEAYKDFINKTIRLVNNTFPESEISNVVDHIVKFEKELHKFATQAREDTKQMNISEFINTTGDNVPMVEILNKDLMVINYTVRNDTEVKVQCAEYYKNVVEYVKNTTLLSAMQNYIGWIIIREMAKAEGTLLHAYYMEYKNKTSIFEGGEEKREDNKTLCVRQLLHRDLMYTAVAHFYVKNKFDNDSKAEVMKILEYVNNTFQFIIKNNTWMSEEIKNKSLKRLEKMNSVIGYPEWLWNNDTVDKLYKFVPKLNAGMSFAAHFFNLKENNHYQQLLKLTYKYINKSYEEVVLKSHGFYDEIEDTVGYPAAALVTHYRKPPIPRATNFATIGTALAQILTNAIDRYDNQRINGSIVEKDFWDNTTTTSFCNNSKCLNNSEQCRNAGADCNSQSHQKLHDYVGVRASHMALARSKDGYTGPSVFNDTKLNTEDKIFFTFFGSLYCPYSVNEKNLSEPEKIVEERADVEEISFPKSLNEIVSIYDKFNSTFNCSGTLNDTCRLVPEEDIPIVGCF
ncbi:neprilysin-1 isoform X1 [Rhipicephalus sanguineus]|uniref:neprilysin-1 isoform X1 n=1 Tax=Rhipicephalus sanguineus TaxID=34632 RepID=UPI001895BF3C|nr:neprilysin-1 isoform X1 [Rhipicephalus sanguineus]